MSTHTDAPGIDYGDLARALDIALTEQWAKDMTFEGGMILGARAVVAAYVEQRRSAGYVEVRAEDVKRAYHMLMDYAGMTGGAKSNMADQLAGELIALVAADGAGKETSG